MSESTLSSPLKLYLLHSKSQGWTSYSKIQLVSWDGGTSAHLLEMMSWEEVAAGYLNICHLTLCGTAGNVPCTLRHNFKYVSLAVGAWEKQ